MKPFEIGLSLTGTVSAGAYTGGVIDFIIEALEEWEKEKQRNMDAHTNDNAETDYSKWDTPWHDVVIKGLSGASGGGVTCGLILNSIGKEIKPVSAPQPGMAINNDFYNSWVNMLGIEQLLQTADLTGESIKSLFNANAIPAIADKVLQKGLFGHELERHYIHPHLTALITLTNLRGIPYRVNFEGAVNPIMYLRHTDYAQFELSPSGALSNDGSYLIPYNINSAAFEKGYSQLKAACLATCAFPAAFKAQPFDQDPRYYYKRNEKYKHYKGLALPHDMDYSFVCSDGGILNTEPFELLRQFMLPPNESQNPRDPLHLERTIIMVAPLETFKDFNSKSYNTKDDLADVLPEDIFAIREEALFSAEEINNAYDEDIYSRFIIAPVRNEAPGSDATCLPAITGTSLGTFGAFLSRDFREHDYFLGRRNAQLFLKKHFVIPVDEAKGNPLFSSVLEHADRFKDLIVDGKYFPIIPLCGTAKNETYFPKWPKDAITGRQWYTIEDALGVRVGKLADIVIDDLELGWFKRSLASFIAKRMEPKLVDKILKAVKVQLIKSDLASNKTLQ